MKYHSTLFLVTGLVLVALAPGILPPRILAGESEVPFEEPSADVEDNLLDDLQDLFEEDPIIGSYLYPHLHAFGAFGDSTGDPADLAVNDHDPNRQANLQTLEPGLSLRWGKLQGFTVASGATDGSGDFSFVLEEGFLKLVDLPLGFEIRGGQFLKRFGFQNAVHNHSWMFVDQNLVNGRFLNEGELLSQGGEISWKVPLPMMQASVVSVSVGGLPAHAHGEEERQGEDSEFEAEGADFTSTLVGANWASQFDISDMKRLSGTLSAAWGDNQFGRDSQVYGMGFEYLWKENGYAPGGHSLRWRSEAMIRHIGAVSGHLHGEEEDPHEEEGGHRAGLDEFGIYSMLIYGSEDRVETGVRGDWVSGISEMGLDERFRVSPMFTWFLNEKRTLQARLQYNWDYSNQFGSDHSIWFQVGFNWGGPEVR